MIRKKLPIQYEFFLMRHRVFLPCDRYCNSYAYIFYRYSGEIYGIGNMFATIPGIVAPVLVNTPTPNVSVHWPNGCD